MCLSVCLYVLLCVMRNMTLFLHRMRYAGLPHTPQADLPNLLVCWSSVSGLAWAGLGCPVLTWCVLGWCGASGRVPRCVWGACVVGGLTICEWCGHLSGAATRKQHVWVGTRMHAMDACMHVWWGAGTAESDRIALSNRRERTAYKRDIHRDTYIRTHIQGVTE